MRNSLRRILSLPDKLNRLCVLHTVDHKFQWYYVHRTRSTSLNRYATSVYNARPARIFVDNVAAD